MYVVIETWSPHPGFPAAAEETRNALFAGVAEATRQRVGSGVVTLGRGGVAR